MTQTMAAPTLLALIKAKQAQVANLQEELDEARVAVAAMVNGMPTQPRAGRRDAAGPTAERQAAGG
jgi:hypothetical protein